MIFFCILIFILVYLGHVKTHHCCSNYLKNHIKNLFRVNTGPDPCNTSAVRSKIFLKSAVNLPRDWHGVNDPDENPKRPAFVREFSSNSNQQSRPTVSFCFPIFPPPKQSLNPLRLKKKNKYTKEILTYPRE